ncbi:MAG: alanine racemase [Bacillota bacterium]|nr:alanine racemase [Bacillota bacterium]
MQYIRPVWAEINLDNLAFNVKQIRHLVGNNVKVMAVVKSNAYGMGISGVLETLLEQGIDMFGVAILDEALFIRKKYPEIPILIFSYTPFEYSHLLIKHDITQTVYCKEQAKALSIAAKRLHKKARIHIEVDTGMGRLGFRPSRESIDIIYEIAELPNMQLEGIYTHCPYTNERNQEGYSFTQSQYDQFNDVVKNLEEKGISIPIKHLCNSLGTVYYKQMHMDMVRAGIILYGSYPQFQDLLPLKPVMSLKAKIGSVKIIGPGENISYGRTFTTERETIVATLPLGYGDGYNRMLSNKGEVLVKGKRAPIIGTICMDQFMVDITDIPSKVKIGEEVVLLGKQGDEEITIEEIAKKTCGFINYEYMVLIQDRVPRVYKKSNP